MGEHCHGEGANSAWPEQGQGCSIPHSTGRAHTPPADHTQEPAGSSHLAPEITPLACAYA